MIRHVRPASFLATLLLLCSCSQAHGGGTYGTGLPDGRTREPGYATALGATVPGRLSGTLRDERGERVSGMILVVETPLDSQRVRIGRSGEFSVVLHAADGDPVRFGLEGGRRLDGAIRPFRHSMNVRLVIRGERKIEVDE